MLNEVIALQNEAVSKACLLLGQKTELRYEMFIEALKAQRRIASA
jgi:hypothetical protein